MTIGTRDRPHTLTPAKAGVQALARNCLPLFAGDAVRSRQRVFSGPDMPSHRDRHPRRLRHARPRLMSEAEWTEARAHLADALKAGWAVLAAGRHALDAVEAAVVVMEDSPHFNAGYGAALTEAASTSSTPRSWTATRSAAGAVCGGAAHPQSGPRRARRDGAVRLRAADRPRPRTTSRHATDSRWSRTATSPRERRVAALASLKARSAPPAPSGGERSREARHGRRGRARRQWQSGGRDLDRRLQQQAAPAGSATAPIIGAGTYAKNGVCAVSCTGQGEFFIRHAAAYDIAARMHYGGASLRSRDATRSSTRR